MTLPEPMPTPSDLPEHVTELVPPPEAIKPRPPAIGVSRSIRSGSVQHSTKYPLTPWTAQLRVHGRTPVETLSALHSQMRELEAQLVALITEGDD